MGNVSIFRIALNFSFLSDVHFRSPCPLQTVQNIEKVGDFQAPFNTPKLHCKFSSATTLGVKTEQPFRHPSPRHPPPPLFTASPFSLGTPPGARRRRASG